MRVASVEAICAALNSDGVRYLIAGGLAVNAHGYLRLTNDVDLVIRLDAANVWATFAALEGVGYRPAVPVRAADLADPIARGRLAAEKGMQVLPFLSERHRETTVDVFVTEPFDFDLEYGAAFVGELTPGLVLRFVRLVTLIDMKQTAGRPRDMDDVQHLRWILEGRGDDQA